VACAADAATYLRCSRSGAIGTVVGGFLSIGSTRRISVPAALSVASFIIWRVSADLGGLDAVRTRRCSVSFGASPHGPVLPRFFGLRSFTTVFAVQMALLALLFGVAAPVTGRIREATGSYDVVIWAAVNGMALSALLYLLLGPYRFAKHIGAVQGPSHRAELEPAKSSDFAQRSTP
jgi:hypothetical protein